MMLFHQTSDPDVLATRRAKGEGCVQAFLALPFLIMTTGSFLAAFGEMDIGWPRWASVLLGVLFAALGLSLLTYRGGMVVDRRRGTLVKWGGVPRLRRTREIPLHSILRVVIARKEFHGDMPEPRVYYRVRLEAKGDSVRLANFRDFQRSRAVAEHAARVFGVKVVDSSGGEGGGDA